MFEVTVIMLIVVITKTMRGVMNIVKVIMLIIVITEMIMVIMIEQ